MLCLTTVCDLCVGIRPKLKSNDFQDLLGAEGFNVQSKSKEPQTLSDMQDIGDLKKEEDPDRAKVILLIKIWCVLIAVLGGIHQ